MFFRCLAKKGKAANLIKPARNPMHHAIKTKKNHRQLRITSKAISVPTSFSIYIVLFWKCDVFAALE